MAEIKAFFDGMCEPNPGGIATWGIVIYKNNDIIHQDCGIAVEPYTPQSTNNVAEYTALINTIQYCLNKGLLTITVYGDSQLAIRQITGEYSVNSPNIIPLYERVIKLTKNFDNISFEWVRRELNQEADIMSKKAYFEYINKNDMFFTFGKYKGEKVSIIAQKNPNYIKWLLDNGKLRPDLKEAIKAILTKTIAKSAI